MPEPVVKKITGWLSKTTARKFTLSALPGDASPRRYFRLGEPGGGASGLMALWGPDPAENMAWLRLGRHLWFQGLPVPRILGHDLDAGFFLLEDLGDRHLAGEAGRRDGLEFYLEAVRVLADFHIRGLQGFNHEWCHQSKVYDAALVYNREFLYFLNETALRILGETADEKLLAEGREFSRLAASGPTLVLMHRDFQSRNLMVSAGRIKVIDWQGARLGPAAHDLASLLEDPYVELPEAWRPELTAVYLKARRITGRDNRRSFESRLRRLGAARLMQALGAYGKLDGQGLGKFAAHIPTAARRLADRLADREFDPFPRLRSLAVRLSTRIKPAPAYSNNPRSLI